MRASFLGRVKRLGLDSLLVRVTHLSNWCHSLGSMLSPNPRTPTNVDCWSLNGQKQKLACLPLSGRYRISAVGFQRIVCWPIPTDPGRKNVTASS